MVRFSAEEHLHDLMAIVGARSHAELQRLLVMHPPALRGPDTLVGIGAFRKVHAAGADGAIQSFILMATDPRWSSIAHDLIRDLIATQLLDDDELDLVAEAIIRADRWLYWACPDEWFDDEATIEISPPGRGDDGDDEGDVDPTDEPAPTLVRRDIPRGTRRWAAERLIRRDVVAWAAVLSRVDDLPANQGAPILLGLLDAADHLPAPAARLVDARGADSGDVVVRLAALRRIASYDVDEALRRGSADSNRRVRDWASAAALSEPPEPTGDHQQPLF